MKKWKEGDRVRIIERGVSERDAVSGRYFAHMAGIVGTVQNVYDKDEVAIKADKDSVGPIARDVHQMAVERMREKFLDSISEEQRKQLTKQELEFDAHYVLLVASSDLEAADAPGESAG